MRRPGRDVNDIAGSQRVAFAAINRRAPDLAGLLRFRIHYLAASHDGRLAALDDEDIGLVLVKLRRAGRFAIRQHGVVIRVAGNILAREWFPFLREFICHVSQILHAVNIYLGRCRPSQSAEDQQACNVFHGNSVSILSAAQDLQTFELYTASMRHFLTGLVLAGAMTVSALAADSGNPFVGRWDFDVHTRSGVGANWLGITEKGGQLDIWFQPTGGHVYQVKDFHTDGSHLTFTASPASGRHPAMIWELDASGDKLTGTQKVGDHTTPLTGARAPELNHPEPKAWTSPQPLFNGKNLDGWEPIGDAAKSHWVVKDGDLVNEARGANLKTARKFEDFKLHFEVNCPDNANSGFYLRGRYELQLEYEAAGSEPMNRQMGSIYGRLAPSTELPRTPGKWETFDVTLVGRKVTVVRNGTTTIDGKEIEGITGGALNADEGEPGPFYIQGDHTGGLKFRNITVAVPEE